MMAPTHIALGLLATTSAFSLTAHSLPQVKLAHQKHFWKFERLVLKNLSGEETRQLIRQALAGLRVPDPQLLETRIRRQSAGNPRAILESVARLRKEPAITTQVVRELYHTGARPQLDLTPALLLPTLLLLAARFLARGIGDRELYILAGIGAALGMALRFFLFRGRR